MQKNTTYNHNCYIYIYVCVKGGGGYVSMCFFNYYCYYYMDF